MTREEFSKLALEWERLNQEYDAYIQGFFNGQKIELLTPEKLIELKKMQQDLYELETTWFGIVEEKITITD